MPFIPAVIGASLIGAGGGIASGLIGAHAQSKAQKALLNSPLTQEQLALTRQQAGYGRQAGDLAGRLFPQYEEGVNYFQNYFKNFLGGDNDAAMQAAAPLLRLRKNQTQGLFRAQDFAPRGGGRGESLFNLRSNENSDIYDIISNERTNARTGYMGLVGDVGTRAQGLLGSAAGTTGAAASTLGLIQGNALQAGRDASENVGNAAGAIGSALGPLLVEWIRSSREKKG
jgi:hypothetical protein